MNILYVALGGALGAMARYGVYLLGAAHLGLFPWPTLLINLSGSLVIGALLPSLATHLTLQTFLVTGFLGAFTTFSTFSFELLRLLRESQTTYAALYAAVSVLGGLLCAFIGWRLNS